MKAVNPSIISISPSHILETEQQCRRDSGLDIHSLDLGIEWTQFLLLLLSFSLEVLDKEGAVSG